MNNSRPGAGPLHHRVAIEAAVTVKDSFGEEIVTGWSLVATVWGSVEDLTGREWMDRGKEWADVTTRIRLRWRQGILPNMRARTRIGREVLLFDIRAVAHPEGRLEWLELMCSRMVYEG